MTELQKYLIYGICWLIAMSIEAIFMIKIKKTNKDQNKKIELARILQKLPELIEEAEKYVGSGNGYMKLNYVLNKVHIMCIEKDLEYNETDFEYEIEKILNTPTKKGEKEYAKTKNA